MLIPKDSLPTTIHEFRPLSLCNVPVKLVSKIIINKLKDILKKLISPCQTNFVPERQGLHNAILCQELVHTSRYSKARRGTIIIKVDLEKAYERLEWSFIKCMLENAGVPNKLIGVITPLVSGGSCKLLWNGVVADEIRPSKGLRQGDPLSPYLLVLCMEIIGQWIGKRVEEGKLRPIKASGGRPGLLFLFFADDLLLFSEAVEVQLVCLKEGLELFCKASGHVGGL